MVSLRQTQRCLVAFLFATELQQDWRIGYAPLTQMLATPKNFDGSLEFASHAVQTEDYWHCGVHPLKTTL